MKKWQVRQQIYQQIFSDEGFGDDLKDQKIIEEWEPSKIIQRALEYPRIQRDHLYYPAKSYAVAITYALLLAKHFGEDFYEVLKNESLLGANDPYFVTYEKSQDIYDAILADFPRDAVDSPQNFSLDFQKTCHYFYLEFLLDEKTSIYAPADGP